MENPDLNININFYNNICEPLFKDNPLLLKAIKLFYNPEIYKKIKESFKFNSNNSTLEQHFTLNRIRTYILASYVEVYLKK